MAPKKKTATPATPATQSDVPKSTFLCDEEDGDDDGEIVLKRNEMLCGICLNPTKKAHSPWGLCCRKDVEAAEEQANSSDDEEDKKLFQECKQDIAKLRPLILAFKHKCPSKGRGSPREKFPFMEYREEQSEMVGTGYGFDGEMMDMEEFICFRKQRRNEPRDEAIKKWFQIDQKTPEEHKKMDGEDANNPLRLPIIRQADKFYGYRNTENKKSMVGTTKQVKYNEKKAKEWSKSMGSIQNPSQAADDNPELKAALAILNKFGLSADKLDGPVPVDDEEEVPSRVGKRGKGKAKAKSKSKPDANADDDDKPEVELPEAPKFELDCERIEGKRKLKESSRKSDTAIKNDRQKLHAAIVLLDSKQAGFEQKFDLEETAQLVRSRLAYLDLVLEGGENFETMNIAITEGQTAKPFVAWNKMISFPSYMEEIVNFGKDATDESGLKADKAVLDHQESQLSAFSVACKKAAQNLTKAIQENSRKQDNAKRKEAQKEQLEAKKAAQKEAAEWTKEKKTIFDVVETDTTALHEVDSLQHSQSDSLNVDFLVPFIIFGCTDLLKIFTDASSPLKIHFQIFCMGFPTDPLYNSKHRGVSDATELAKELGDKSVNEMILQSVKAKLWDVAAVQASGDSENVVSTVESALKVMSFCAAARDHVLSGCDSHGMATFRLQVDGTRQLRFTNRKHFRDFLAKSSKSDSTAKAADVFKDASQSLVAQYIASGGAIYKVTVPPGSLLFLPVNTLYAEQIVGADAFSVRVPFMGEGFDMFAEDFVAMLVSGGFKPNSKDDVVCKYFAKKLAKAEDGNNNKAGVKEEPEPATSKNAPAEPGIVQMSPEVLNTVEPGIVQVPPEPPKTSTSPGVESIAEVEMPPVSPEAEAPMGESPIKKRKVGEEVISALKQLGEGAAKAVSLAAPQLVPPPVKNTVASAVPKCGGTPSWVFSKARGSL